MQLHLPDSSDEVQCCCLTLTSRLVTVDVKTPRRVRFNSDEQYSIAESLHLLDLLRVEFQSVSRSKNQKDQLENISLLQPMSWTLKLTGST